MKNKQCFKCEQTKPLSEYYLHPRMADGHLNKCKECTRLDVKGRSKREQEKVRAYDTYRYRHNLERIKKHKYRGIKDRCNGNHKNRKYFVEGLDYLSWEEYNQWWNQNLNEFMKCYAIWQQNEYKNRFAPSIDRIDSKKGYTPENMQWLVFSTNCSKYNK